MQGCKSGRGKFPVLSLWLPPLFQITPFFMLILPGWVHPLFYLIYPLFSAKLLRHKDPLAFHVPHCSSRGVKIQVVLGITRWKSRLLYKGRNETKKGLVSWGFFWYGFWIASGCLSLKCWKSEGTWENRGVWVDLDEHSWKGSWTESPKGSFPIFPTFPCRVCRENLTKHWGQCDAEPKLNHKPKKIILFFKWQGRDAQDMEKQMFSGNLLLEREKTQGKVPVLQHFLFQYFYCCIKWSQSFGAALSWWIDKKI